MGAYTLKRAFAGKFVVMTGAGEDAEQVFGPVPRAEALAWVAEREGPAPASPVASGPGEEPTPAQLRAWSRKVATDLQKPRDEEEAELRAVLLKRRSEDETDYLLRQMKPLLAAGLEGGRRERHRPMRAAPRAA
jgi:hypothetical protein